MALVCRLRELDHIGVEPVGVGVAYLRCPRLALASGVWAADADVVDGRVRDGNALDGGGALGVVAVLCVVQLTSGVLAAVPRVFLNVKVQNLEIASSSL